MIVKLTKLERKVLAEINDPGSQKDIVWGAGMSVALEFLRGSGLITRGLEPELTDVGRKALRAG